MEWTATTLNGRSIMARARPYKGNQLGSRYINLHYAQMKFKIFLIYARIFKKK